MSEYGGVGLEPAPVPGCQVCAELARQRERDRGAHDWSGVTDCNVLLRRHRAPNDHAAQPR